MSFIEGCDRLQRQLLPACVEDYVRPDNPVRFVDAFVDSLDLAACGFEFPEPDPLGRGRPGYHPAVLLKLYLYGYLHQIRSSRRLEAESERNLEVIWLLSQRSPDFKTIADFRRDNREAFKSVVRQFNRLCGQLDLFGGELIAIDGTKMKGQNAPAKNWSLSKLHKQIAQLDEYLEKYLKELDQTDQQTPADQPPKVSQAKLEEKIRQLKEKKQQAKTRLEQVQASGQTQISATDADSRSMKSARGYVVGYNVQGAVDAKHHLLIVTEATTALADNAQLVPMAQAAKQELGVSQAEVVADGGYYAGLQLKQCQEMGMEPHVPVGLQSSSERAGLYGKDLFKYDAVSDTYQCPAGRQLSRRGQREDKGRVVISYSKRAACKGCPLKSQCTQTEYRTVSRWEFEECLERVAAQVAAHPEKLASRKTLIEHCWGTLKWLLPGGFLVRGLSHVGAELSLAHWGYNFKRACKVVGLSGLLAALQSFGSGPAAAG